MDTEENLKQLVSQVDELPTLPTVVTRLVTLVEESDTSARDLNAVITQDPSLTAKVLKLVNSAFYGFSREISTVTEAVVILGFDAIKSLALSASVLDVFSGEGLKRFDRVGVWKHSIATGIAAELVASWDRYPNPEEVMVSGILHNIGKMLLDLSFQEQLAKILDNMEENEVSMQEAELEIIGVDHPSIGAWLAEQWNLPENIVMGIKYYRQPMKAPEELRKLPLFVHVGDVLTRTKNIGWTGDDLTLNYHEEIWTELELTNEDIEMLLTKLEQNVDKADEFIKLASDQERSG